MLREEAAAKVGGETILSNMIAQNKVKCTVDDKGVETVYFPRVSFGTKESFGEQQQTSRGKFTTPEVHTHLQQLISSLNWDFSDQLRIEAVM